MLIGACRIEHLGKAQKRVKAGKKAVTSGPSALLKVFSKEDQHDDGGAKKKEGEGEARKEGPSQDPELAKRESRARSEDLFIWKECPSPCEAVMTSRTSTQHVYSERNMDKSELAT